MNKYFKITSYFLMVFLMANSVLSQETTGSIEITVTDSQGNVVPNSSVTVESADVANTSTAGYKRTVTTDDNGFYRLLQLQPGVYKVTVAPISGFQERVINNVQVSLGKITPVNVELGTSVSASVDVTEIGGSPIDPTDSKLQTTINAQAAELLPRGVSFTSILKVAPAVRNEPNSGGFQVDGASGAENTFIVDGQEVTNFRTGTLDTNNELPFQLVQEVQIKSSGFEAEFGGATGGVVNVVTKGGGNAFRGEFGINFRPQRLQAGPRRFLDPTYLGDYFQPRRDGGNGFFPSATLSGPIVKNRLWFFGSYSPQIFNVERRIDYIDPSVSRTRVTASETYTAKQTNEYALGRLDAQPISSLRLTGTYRWNPTIFDGVLPTFGSLYSPIPSVDFGAPIGVRSGSNLLGQQGGRQNSNNTTAQAVWTPTGNFILSARFGYNFLNENGATYGVPSVGNAVRILCSGLGLTPPASAGCARGASNGVPAFQQQLFDVSTRTSFDADATFITNLLGRHEIKGGYQYNGLANQVSLVSTPQVVLRYGRTIGETAGRQIVSTPGAIGSGFVRRFARQGDVSSSNQGIFLQDKYQPFRRLTLNLGFRTEQETVPSFAPGAPDLKFNFNDKIAPRIGVAFDLTGDGKTKLSAFYGWFFDRFKYELPRGSFGGEFFRDDFFEIFSTDGLFTTFTPTAILGANPRDVIGGSCPQTGFVFGRVRCQLDRRIPSNAGLGLEFGAIDPNIKPFRQEEITVNVERELGNNFVVSGRYTRKDVKRAVEDVGFLTSSGGEAYVIGNPGFGLARSIAEQNNFVPVRAKRQSDVLEFRLDKRFANNYYFNANYTYSRLFGNYSGLASSDEDGRTSPNVNRFFDLPISGFTAQGTPDEGRLATDRPHVFKFAGSYNLDWNKLFGGSNSNSTEFSAFTSVSSGTPQTTFVDILGIETIPLFGRGDLGRSKTFSETDFAVRHRYKFGRDNKFTLVSEVDVTNVFNQSTELGRYNLINGVVFGLLEPQLGLLTAAERLALDEGDLSEAQATAIAVGRFQRRSTSAAISDYIRTEADGNDPRFNKSDQFQTGRRIRFGFRLIF